MSKRTCVRGVLGAALLMTLAACGSGDLTGSSSSNDMRVVAGDEDKVEADGTIELTSEEIATCKDFVYQAHKVHDNMQAWADTGSSGSGWQSYTAGLIGWLQDLELEIKTAETPELLDALHTIAEGGAPALEAVAGGTAPAEEDYDGAKILTGLEDTAEVCEAAGVNIVWY